MSEIDEPKTSYREIASDWWDALNEASRRPEPWMVISAALTLAVALPLVSADFNIHASWYASLLYLPVSYYYLLAYWGK